MNVKNRPLTDSPKIFSTLLQAGRPKTLFVSIAPILFALMLVPAAFFNPLKAWLTLVVGVCFQMGANFSNDYWDAKNGIDNEATRLGPKRMGSLKAKEAQLIKWSYRVCFAVGFMAGLLLVALSGLPWLVLVGLGCLFAAYAYSGTSAPLSHRALGEFLAFFFFGPVAMMGTYILQTYTFNWEVIILSISPGLLSANLMAINNLRDRESDQATVKTTMATLTSDNFMRLFICINFLVVSALPFAWYALYHFRYFHSPLVAPPSIFLLSLGLYFFAIVIVKTVFTGKKVELNKSLMQTALYSLGQVGLWKLTFISLGL